MVKGRFFTLPGFGIFLNSLSDPCHVCKYNLLQKNNLACLLIAQLIYIDVIFIFTFYLLL
jgi:hypothetical protein